MLRQVHVPVLASLLLPAFCRAQEPAGGPPAVSEEFGVVVVHSHLADPPVATAGGVEVLKPVYPADHDFHATWKVIAERRREGIEHVVPAPLPRPVRAAPPWTYTPHDQTYTPKTDWTYHPRVGKYTRKPTWAFRYTPPREREYRPKQYGSWS